MAMEGVETARSRDFNRRLTREAHDAKSAAGSLTQIFAAELVISFGAIACCSGRLLAGWNLCPIVPEKNPEFSSAAPQRPRCHSQA